MILELKDYADRYGFEDFAVELGNMLETILESKPGEIMSIAAQASAMGVSRRPPHCCMLPFPPPLFVLLIRPKRCTPPYCVIPKRVISIRYDVRRAD